MLRTNDNKDDNKSKNKRLSKHNNHIDTFLKYADRWKYWEEKTIPELWHDLSPLLYIDPADHVKNENSELTIKVLTLAQWRLQNLRHDKIINAYVKEFSVGPKDAFSNDSRSLIGRCCLELNFIVNYLLDGESKIPSHAAYAMQLADAFYSAHQLNVANIKVGESENYYLGYYYNHFASLYDDKPFFPVNINKYTHQATIFSPLCKGSKQPSRKTIEAKALLSEPPVAIVESYCGGKQESVDASDFDDSQEVLEVSRIGGETSSSLYSGWCFFDGFDRNNTRKTETSAPRNQCLFDNEDVANMLNLAWQQQLYINEMLKSDIFSALTDLLDSKQESGKYKMMRKIAKQFDGGDITIDAFKSKIEKLFFLSDKAQDAALCSAIKLIVDTYRSQFPKLDPVSRPRMG